jgi:hypothetical protein
MNPSEFCTTSLTALPLDLVRSGTYGSRLATRSSLNQDNSVETLQTARDAASERWSWRSTRIVPMPILWPPRRHQENDLLYIIYVLGESWGSWPVDPP